MKTTILYRALAAAALLAALHSSLASARAQGSLTPPDAPAATMKTLAQIEPRTPISSAPFTISARGSYYLTTNLTGTSGTSGITINASDITVDLAGFALVGVPGALNGIIVIYGSTNVTVCNGTVRGWPGDGVNVNSAHNTTLHGLRACANGGTGLYTGIDSVITDCIASANKGVGIMLASGVARDCVATGNGMYGINAGSHSAIFHCTASGNTNSGILTDGGGIVNGCTANANTEHGIYTWSASEVTGCVTVGNSTNGIIVFSQCRVIGNTSTGNGAGVSGGAGIRVLGNGCRIEDNNVIGNDWGIRVDSAGNFIVKNTARGNTTNYFTSGTQTIGPIVTATGIITTNSPWANFEF